MIYKKDYYGYIYEWTNIKNGMKYIGSHFGAVEDYYIGSGKRFIKAYRKNPKNFTLKVLEYVSINDRKMLLMTEQKWLDSIPNIRENNMYYNLNNFSLGGSSHITRKHIEKRSKTLTEKHKKLGLSDAEKNSYQKKIQTRLERISKKGFTEKEKTQYSSYGYKICVIMPDGSEKKYNSCGSASKELKIDTQYGLKVCMKKDKFKGYRIIKLSDPIIDCRGRTNETI